MKKTIFLFIFAILISGCATVHGPKNLTREIIEEKIIKGKTTKEEVRILLGKPSTAMVSNYQMPMVDMTKYGGTKIDMSEAMPYETWSYVNITEGITKEKGQTFPLFGTMYRKIGSLAISFDKKGIVKSYAFTEINQQMDRFSIQDF